MAAEKPQSDLSLTLCICTANRPDVLRRCLRAIADGTRPPAEVLVSDDSPDGTETQAVCADFDVRYLPGPRRGLCAHRYETIHLNCNLFPRTAFDHAGFDESIVYGYEDMDLCSHLLSQGFHIRYCPELLNDHIRPAGVPTKRYRQKEEARFYVSLKRYLLWDKHTAKAGIYLVLAPLQRAAHSIKIRDLDDLRFCVPDMVSAFRATLRERSRLRSGPSPV